MTPKIQVGNYSDQGAATLFVSGAAVRTIFLPER
jgi:hypothetical protein